MIRLNGVEVESVSYGLKLCELGVRGAVLTHYYLIWKSICWKGLICQLFDLISACN